MFQFYGSYKGVSRMLQDVEIEVSKMFYDYFKGSSMNVQGCLQKVILMSNPTAVEVELS